MHIFDKTIEGIFSVLVALLISKDSVNVFFRNANVYGSSCSVTRNRMIRGNLYKNRVKVFVKNVSSSFSRSVVTDVQLLCIVDGMEINF